MSEAIVAKRQAIDDAAKKIDSIASVALKHFENAGDFTEELEVARAMIDMRGLLTPELMAPVLAMMNTDLGFRTDRDPKVKNSRGEYPAPYQIDVVREVFIEARLRGLRLIGNEFNIIAARCYATKNGLERLVRDITKGTCEISIDPPQMLQGFAKVKCRATWKFKNETFTIGVRAEDPCEYLVRVNEFMGPDGAMGKAERKIYKRIYARLTGKDVGDVEPGENAEHVAGSDKTVHKSPNFAKAGDDEKELAADGLAPVAQASATPEPAINQVTPPTPQQEMAALMGEAGVSFDDFRGWLDTTGRVEDATKYDSFESLPEEVCIAAAKDTKALSKCVSLYGKKKK